MLGMGRGEVTELGCTMNKNSTIAVAFRESDDKAGLQGAKSLSQNLTSLMVISLSQTFHAKWTLHAHKEMATYNVQVSIEGPERPFMTDVAPIVEEINQLEGEDLSAKIGKSSLEAVVLHIRGIANKHLDARDRIKGIKLTENGFFTVSIGNND